jgi:hypothetical protein
MKSSAKKSQSRENGAHVPEETAWSSGMNRFTPPNWMFAVPSATIV